MMDFLAYLAIGLIFAGVGFWTRQPLLLAIAAFLFFTIDYFILAGLCGFCAFGAYGDAPKPKLNKTPASRRRKKWKHH